MEGPGPGIPQAPGGRGARARRRPYDHQPHMSITNLDHQPPSITNLTCLLWSCSWGMNARAAGAAGDEEEIDGRAAGAAGEKEEIDGPPRPGGFQAGAFLVRL